MRVQYTKDGHITNYLFPPICKKSLVPFVLKSDYVLRARGVCVSKEILEEDIETRNVARFMEKRIR